MTSLDQSSHRPNAWLSLFVWLLPNSRFKTCALRRLGNQIGKDVKLAPTLVLGCGRFIIRDGALLAPFNIFRNLSSAELGPFTVIGSWNQFTAAPGYQQFSPYVGKLLMGDRSVITNRHYFDCSGQIILRPFAGVGGIKSIFQSHEIDLQDDVTKVGRVTLGENAMTGTACILLKDAYLPERAILGAGSLLTKKKDGADMPPSSLYAGVPARYVRGIEGIKWWDRTSNYTAPIDFDDSVFRIQYSDYVSTMLNPPTEQG